MHESKRALMKAAAEMMEASTEDNQESVEKE